MKTINMVAVIVSLFILLNTSAMAGAKQYTIVKSRPGNFVNIKKIIPSIQVDARYYSKHNFVGKRINGYKAPVCLLTKQAAVALKKVQDKLKPMHLSLKTYDCYRPQRAVDNFASWAKKLQNTKMKREFYPGVNKVHLFEQGYIAYHSGHSRGSTFDVTIVPSNSIIPTYDEHVPQVACTQKKSLRTPDNSLDFGTGFDCFSPKSHPDYKKLPAQSKANRLLLRRLMINAGFKPLKTEWWHFTLKNEPYPNTYFNFPVQ